ncbi:MAG: orotidine-5'-phosphate decarboxylase [Bacillota bacterium]
MTGHTAGPRSLGDPRSARDRLILALDVPTPEEALALAGRFRGRLAWVKVGMELFTVGGPSLVRQMGDRGLKIFLDLKFHDIPSTVARATAAATELGVAMFNVHAAGGREMMASAVDAARSRASALGIAPPLVIAVTVLTSIDQGTLNREVGLAGGVADHVERFALAARDAGCDGVVASPLEVQRIKSVCGPTFIAVTPGVRPSGNDAGDQRRTLTPAEALRAGSDYLVVGRPVTRAADPVAALESILSEMEEATAHA